MNVARYCHCWVVVLDLGHTIFPVKLYGRRAWMTVFINGADNADQRLAEECFYGLIGFNHDCLRSWLCFPFYRTHH